LTKKWQKVFIKKINIGAASVKTQQQRISLGGDQGVLKTYFGNDDAPGLKV
jgi:hypothetical protein